MSPLTVHRKLRRVYSKASLMLTENSSACPGGPLLIYSASALYSAQGQWAEAQSARGFDARDRRVMKMVAIWALLLGMIPINIASPQANIAALQRTESGA